MELSPYQQHQLAASAGIVGAGITLDQLRQAWAAGKRLRPYAEDIANRAKRYFSSTPAPTATRSSSHKFRSYSRMPKYTRKRKYGRRRYRPRRLKRRYRRRRYRRSGAYRGIRRKGYLRTPTIFVKPFKAFDFYQEAYLPIGSTTAIHSHGHFNLRDPTNPMNLGNSREVFGFTEYANKFFKQYRVRGVAVRITIHKMSGTDTNKYQNSDAWDATTNEPQYVYRWVQPLRYRGLNDSLDFNTWDFETWEEMHCRPGCAVRSWRPTANTEKQSGGYQDRKLSYKKYISLRKFMGVSAKDWEDDSYWNDTANSPTNHNTAHLQFGCGSNYQLFSATTANVVVTVKARFYIEFRHPRFIDPTNPTPATRASNAATTYSAIKDDTYFDEL